jgi:hypothetical protein
MTIAPETAMVRLRRLFRDANYCQCQSNEQALNWALKPEVWAEQQIRFRNWSWFVCEATVKNARVLTNRIVRAAQDRGLTAQELVSSFPFPASPELEPEA